MSENQDPQTNEQAPIADQQPVDQQPVQGKDRHDMGVGKVPAPVKPLPGSAIALPMTGAGPHRAPKVETDEDDNAKKQIGAAPAIPQSTSKHPPRPARPARPPRKPAKPVAATSPPSPQAPTVPPQVSAPAPLPIHDPATASLLLATLNSQRQTGQKFILMVVAENDWPNITEHDDINSCIAEIKQWLGSNCHVFAFMGQRMPISDGPNHFLHTPMGPMPLFDIPEPAELNEVAHGWVGDKLYLEEPPQTEEAIVSDDELLETEDDVDESDPQSSEPLPVDSADSEESGDTPLF